MSEKTDEWFSALVDGELSSQAQANLIPQLHRDPELRERWSSYHLIRDTLRNNLPPRMRNGLAERVARALDDEPTVLAPRRFTWPSFRRQVAGLGVAATIAAVAILAVPNATQEPERADVVASAAKPASEPEAAEPAVAPENWNGPSQSVDYKLSGYLVNHNEYSVVSGMQGALPYMRIVGAPATQHASDETR